MPIATWMRGVIPLNAALGVVLGGQALLLLVGALVIWRKARRDRAERASARRRAEFAAALQGGGESEMDRIARRCVAERGAVADLVHVLRHGVDHPEPRRAALLAAAERSGLLTQLRQKLAARKATARGTAALALAALGMPAAEVEIASLLSDPDSDVRLAAVAAISEVGTAEAAAALIEALAHNNLPPARLVERLGSAWAAPVVHAVLQRELRQSGDVPRAQLAQALGLASYSAAEPCVLALLERGSKEERISAARALGHAGSERSIPALMDALTSEDWVLQAQAARSLGQLHADVAVEELAGCLTDRAWWVRKQAGHALRHLGARGLAALRKTVAHADRYARDRAEQELRVAAVLEAAKLAPPEEPEGATI